MITAQASVVGFSLEWSLSGQYCGYRDMDRIDIGIKMQYRYRYRYQKKCNDMQPYSLQTHLGALLLGKALLIGTLRYMSNPSLESVLTNGLMRACFRSTFLQRAGCLLTACQSRLTRPTRHKVFVSKYMNTQNRASWRRRLRRRRRIWDSVLDRPGIGVTSL